MAIVRCADGHFYDSAKSEFCPYCESKSNNGISISRNSDGSIQINDQLKSNSINEDVTVAFWENDASTSSETVSIGGGVSERPKWMGIAGTDEDVTVGILYTKPEKKDSSEEYKPAEKVLNVTGWLVAVDGPCKGRDYRIANGNNWIGKSFNMDIVINEDDQIEEYKHCFVTYDNKYNKFYITPGSGSLTYYKGKPLTTSQELSLGDEIKMGSSTFEFVPFCREGRVWE